MRSEPSPTRSRTRGQRTATGPMPADARGGPATGSRPRSARQHVWRARLQPRPPLPASTTLARRCAAPRCGSAKVPGWESGKTLVSVTAYHSFGGELGASNTPRIRRLTSLCRHQLSPIALGGPWALPKIDSVDRLMHFEVFRSRSVLWMRPDLEGWYAARQSR